MPKVKLTYKDGEWYRNGEVITDLDNYKFYDQKKKSTMVLTPDGKIEKYSYFKKLLRAADRSDLDKFRKAISTSARVSKDKITLKTKGRMNLADIPVNMLDSIAINTGRSDTNIKDNLGLIGKETTFGGHSKALGSPWRDKESFDGYDLTNNHAYFTTPEIDYLGAIARNANDNLEYAEEAAKQAYKQGLIKPVTPQYHDNPMTDAFIRYATNPQGYNPGQGNYVQMVTNIGDEVWNEPQIQGWWNTQGKEFYNKGLKERFKEYTPYKTPYESSYDTKDLYDPNQEVEVTDKDGWVILPKPYKK